MSIAVVWNGGAGGAAGLTAAEVGEKIGRATGRAVTIEEVSDARDPVACARAAIDRGENVVRALEVLAPPPPPAEGTPTDASLIGLPDLEVG